MKSCLPALADQPAHYQENIEDYLRFSRAADAILTAAANVNAGTVPDDDVLLRFAFENHVLELDEVHFREVKDKYPNAGIPERYLLDSARIQIGQEVSLWLEVAGVRPELRWDQEKRAWAQPSAHSPLGILGAIALALLASIPESEWLVCDVCRSSYLPTRRPASGRNHYCRDCRDEPEMWAYLKRQQRARERAKLANFKSR